MTASIIAKHFTDGLITLKDGTGTPVSLAVPFSMGDFALSGLVQGRRATNVYETRGQLVSLRKGAKSFPTGSFSCMLADYSDATDQTVFDFLNKSGSYAANISTTVAKGDVYTVDIVFTVEGTDLGDSADHTLTLEDCDCSMDLSEGEPNSISISFTVYGTVTAT